MDNFFKDKEKKKILFHIFIRIWIFFCSSFVLVALCSKHVAHSPCAVSFFFIFLCCCCLFPSYFTLLQQQFFLFFLFLCLKKGKWFSKKMKKGTRPEPKSNLLKRKKHEMMFYDGANQCFYFSFIISWCFNVDMYIYMEKKHWTNI